MRVDVLDRACAGLWSEIRMHLGRLERIPERRETEVERRAVLARVAELRALSARYREVRRREAWAAWESG